MTSVIGMLHQQINNSIIINVSIIISISIVININIIIINNNSNNIYCSGNQ